MANAVNSGKNEQWETRAGKNDERMAINDSFEDVTKISESLGNQEPKTVD